MKYILLISLLFIIQNINAQTFPNAASLSTGQGAIGTNDPIWTTSQLFGALPPLPTDPTIIYGPAEIQNNCAPGAWVNPATLPPPVNNGNWITALGNGPCSGAAGYTYYRLTLNLPAACGNNPVTVAGNYVLNFDGYVDNGITAVYINGNDEGVTPGGSFAAGSQKNIILDGPWLAGVNYVDILVYNGGGPGGLLLVANTAAPSATQDDDGDGVTNLNDNCPCVAGNDNAGCTTPPNNCNTSLIRNTLIAAGNAELLGMDNSCSIYFINTQTMTGPNAQAYAQTFGANLISVQSATENNGVRVALANQGFAGNVIWLGFSDALSEGNFVWYDGSPVTYTNWNGGEPNNGGGNENCTQIQPAGTWNDLNCNGYNSMSVIEVSLCPQVAVTTNKPNHCVGDNIMLIASTILGSPSYNYIWAQTGNTTIAYVDKTGNNDTVLVKSTVANTFTVTSTDRYGCTGANVITTTPNPPPTLSLTPTMVDCFGAANGAITVAATGATAPYTYTWSNAANTATITALAPAKYVVTVTDAKGCIKKDSTTITEPASALSISNTVITNVKCFGGNDGSATLVATGGTPPYTYGWLTAPPQLTATASGLIAGTYNYGVKDAHNCQVIGTATITEPTQLTVAITGDKANCANDVTTALTTLTATAANGTGPNYTYSWTPTNATTNTTLCTSTVGTTVYTVTATDQNNCTATANVSHVVNPNPVVTYSVAPVCFNQPSAFTSIVTVVPVADITLYAWQFNGSGVPATATSSLINPTYTFANCNQAYSATLVVQSNKGCIGVSNTAVPATVYCLPVPNFTANDDCAKDATITFNNTSANGAGTIGALANAWLLDSTGAITTSASPTHVYTYAGTYTIPLIVKDVNNCVDTIIKTLKIYPKPEANFTLTKGCFGKPTLMSNTTTIVNPAGFTDVVNGYKWDYDNLNNNFTTDVTTSGASTTYPITATEQSPNATLIVTTNHNCSDTLSKLVTVWPLPIAEYSVSEPCFPKGTTFINNSSVSGGTDNSAVTTMALDWGDTQSDNITFINQVKTHTYAVSDAYNTELTVTSNHNCVTKKQVPIIIHPKPTALFRLTPNEGCSPVCASFTNQSTQLNLPANEPITNYAWNMGDYNFIKISDNTASTQNATHCYENTSDTTQHYTITLIVSTAYGCADTLVKTDSIAVYALPKASFNVTPKVVDLLNPEMIITDKSHLADELKWVYNTGGDTTTVSNSTPLNSTFPYRYTYKDSGVYTILQVAITNNGCIDTATQTVNVKPVYTLYIPNTFTPNDDRINDYFMIKGTGIKTLTLTIYDRWGTVVGKVEDPTSKGWDGNDIKNSTPCKTDVYNWKLNYTDIFNAQHEGITGQVILMK